MKKTAKPLIAAAALLTMVSACKPSAQPTAANGGSTASATSPTATATENNPEQTSTTSPPDSGTMTPAATSNQVILGAQFLTVPATVSFGQVAPGQSATLSFGITNSSSRSATVATIIADDEAFSPSTECNGRTLDPGDSCTFSVTFSPADSRDYRSFLNIPVDPDDLSAGFPLAGSAGPDAGSSAPASEPDTAGSSSP